MLKPMILVVEDNPTLLEGLNALLEFAGYRMATAENGREALKLLDEIAPDLIISDITMPGIDGYEFQSKVRERPELLGVPFIFLTARGGKAEIRLGKELGADDYITKPFDEEDLLSAVRSKLSRWEDLRKVRDEQIEDVKKRILLTMSHEFRTPLTYILNYAEMLKPDEQDISEEEYEQFMNGICKGATRLNRLVEDFILLVELETGEMEKAYHSRRAEIPNTSSWLRSVGHRSQEETEAKGLTLILDIPDDLPPIVVDEKYIADAITRLLANAVKFSMPMSESVRLVAGVRDDTLRVSVEDQGVGIPEKEMASLFNIFHQIDRAKREQQGTGLGLAICMGIVTIHGGQITVESEDGVGSMFTIELPLKNSSRVP